MTRIAAEFSDSRSNRDAVDVGIARAGAAAAAKRRELGITQRSLARDGVINAGALIAFEKGRSWPRRQTRIRLEQVLGWPPGTISGIRSGGPAPLCCADPLRPASPRLGSSRTDIIEQPVEEHTLALLVGVISTAVTTASGGIAALPVRTMPCSAHARSAFSSGSGNWNHRPPAPSASFWCSSEIAGSL